MGNIIVVYESKYGASEQYARMLSEELDCPALTVKSLTPKEWSQAKTVVLCGGVYQNKIAGWQYLQKHFAKQPGQQCLLLVAGALPKSQERVEQLKQLNLKHCEGDIPVFYVQGKWDESKLHVMDRMMCSMLKKMVDKKPPEEQEPWEQEFSAVFGQKHDWVQKESLLPLLSYLKESNLV